MKAIVTKLLGILPPGKEPVLEALFALPVLSFEQQTFIHKVIKKYEFTLSTIGIKIPPAPIKLPGEPYFVEFAQGKFLLRLSDSHAEHIHMVPKARFDRKTGLYSIPYRLYPVLRLHAFVKQVGIYYTDTAKQAILDMYSEMRSRYKASMAHDAELDMAGFGLALDPYQRAGIKGALRFKRGFLADEMGLGKTRQALGVIWLSQAYPALVVCPASLPINWEKEAIQGLVGRRVYRCKSKRAPQHTCERKQICLFPEAQYNPDCLGCKFDVADIIIVNYDKLPDGWKCQYDEEGRRIKGRKREKGEHAEVQLSELASALKSRGIRSIIIDESYYIKNEISQRTKAVQEITGRPEIRLALSGTPIKSRPGELVSQLKILDRLDDLGGEEVFYRKYCGASNTGDIKGSSEETELNKMLRAVGFIQRNKRDIRKELPPVRECEVWVEIDNREEYNRVEIDIVNWCAEQAVLKEEFQKMLQRLNPHDQDDAIERKMIETRIRIMRVAALVRVGALKRVAAKGKLSAGIEWIKEFLQSEKRLVTFAHHRDIQHAIQEHFNCLHIFGSDTLATREHHKDIYMQLAGNDLGLNQQQIVCSLGAAREGWNLDLDDYLLLFEPSWTPAEEMQAVARIDRHRVHNINAYRIIAEDTIEVKIHLLLQDRRKIVNAVTQGLRGAASAKELSIVDSLVSELATMSTHKISAEDAASKARLVLSSHEDFGLSTLEEEATRDAELLEATV